MANRVSISNLALTILGADRITSLEDNSENARRLLAIYLYCLEDLLRCHPWNFAIKRASLARLATTPLFEYAYEYQLPPDSLRILEVNDGTKLITDYKIEDKKLLSDFTNVYIKYITNVTDANQYTSQFIMVFSARLAAEIAYAVTNNKIAAKTIADIYDARLQIAKATDAQESDSVNTVDGDLWTIESRI